MISCEDLAKRRTVERAVREHREVEIITKYNQLLLGQNPSVDVFEYLFKSYHDSTVLTDSRKRIIAIRRTMLYIASKFDASNYKEN